MISLILNIKPHSLTVCYFISLTRLVQGSVVFHCNSLTFMKYEYLKTVLSVCYYCSQKYNFLLILKQLGLVLDIRTFYITNGMHWDS